MTHLLTVLARLSINLEYLPIVLIAVAVVFTVLYWWNARRAFRLELDRVVLWFMLEGGVKKKRYKEQAQEYITELADIPFLDTLLSKKLRKRLKTLEKKQEESTSDLRNHLDKKDLDDDKTEGSQNEK